MYLGSAQQIQNHLNDDWTAVLKNLRLREDLYQELLHNNHKIFQTQSNNSEQNQEMPQIQPLHILITKIKQQQNSIRQEQQRTMEKYEGATVSFQSCIKLMGRIGAKVLQLLKTAADRVRSLEDCSYSNYNHFRSAFIVILTQKEKINLQQAFKLVTEYSKLKLENHLHRLQAAVKNIQNGERISFIQLIKQKVSTQGVGDQLKKRENHFFLRNKQQSANVSKQEKSESKKQEKSKKKKTKTIENLYNIMGLSKYRPNEELSGTLQQNAEKLYNQLLSKNKLNSNQITAFIKKFEQLQTKPQNFKQQFTRGKEIQNKSMSFMQPSKKNSTQSQQQNEKDDYFQYIATEIQTNIKENHNQAIKNHIKKLSMTRTKLNSPLLKGEDFPHLSNKMKNQQLTSIKTDFSRNEKNQNITNRLPHIKRTSLDHKTGIFYPKAGSEVKETIDNIQQSTVKAPKRRQSFMREQRIVSQRAKLVLKSVHVGVDISNKRGQRFCKQQQLGSYQKKKTDTTVESTIYMRKTITKFLDNKLNLFL